MPFEIVRNDIINMQVDAVVNTANPDPVIGSGVDSGIHKKAGPDLIKARREVGSIGFGEAVVTPGFGLDAKYVIHTAGPVWKGGHNGEAEILASCYRRSLALAKAKGCESVAFPLISTGNYGFPKPLALQTAVREISAFLMDNEMLVYLVVFEKESFALSEKLFRSVSSYIDENYIRSKTVDEYGTENPFERRYLRSTEIYYDNIGGKPSGDFVSPGVSEPEQNYPASFDKPEYPDYEDALTDILTDLRAASEEPAPPALPAALAGFASHDYHGESKAKLQSGRDFDETAAFSPAPSAQAPADLGLLMENLDAGFSETLLKLIDRTGKKDSEIYKKANVDRKLFSKIRNNIDYRPSKATALAFAFALELDLEETKDLIGRAGFALSRSSKFDVIAEYFLENKKYDVFELNEVLFYFDQPLIGA